LTGLGVVTTMPGSCVCAWASTAAPTPDATAINSTRVMSRLALPIVGSPECYNITLLAKASPSLRQDRESLNGRFRSAECLLCYTITPTRSPSGSDATATPGKHVKDFAIAIDE